MADDLSKYEEQLKMVEGALLNDARNEELIKLKADFEELIALTQDLIKTPSDASKQSNIISDCNDEKPAIEDLGADNLKVKFGGDLELEIVSGTGLKRPHSGDYLKKMKQKKRKRFQQYEEERENEKNKWLSFHSKAVKKFGVKTKSIFASPDNLTGRVGIGTCGISGKPMTEYTPGEKWKKSV